MKTIATLCLAGALLGAGPAALAAVLPAGTQVTGTVAGATDGLLGLDAGFADVPGSNVTGVSASELEYLTRDFAVAVDFLTTGAVVFYDNTGFGALAGSYTFTFDFAGLDGAIAGFAVSDLGSVTGGSVVASVLNPHAVRITLRDLAFDAPFATFTAQLVTVPEPGALALVLGGLGCLAALRRTARTGRT